VDKIPLAATVDQPAEKIVTTDKPENAEDNKA
jgi:hypothetical protein